MHIMRVATLRRKVSEREGAPDGVQSLVQLRQEGNWNSIYKLPWGCHEDKKCLRSPKPQ